MAKSITPSDVVWTYSGVRPLFDDGDDDPSAVTRDYHLELEPHPGPQLLSVFGGKITTARALAQKAVEGLAEQLKLDARNAPDVGEDVGRHHRCGEVERGHSGELVA